MREEIDAGARLVSEFNEHRPVKASLWVKASDSKYRYLYIASDGINDTNFGTGYGEVLRLAGKINPIDLDPFRVKLISADHPLARSAEEVHRRFPGPMRHGSTGDVWRDEC